MKQFLKWWPVIVGCVVAVVWLITASLNIGRMQWEAEDSHAESVSEDTKLHKRIDHTDREVGKLGARVNKMHRSQVRLETNQATILRNQDRMLERMEDIRLEKP